LTSRDLEILAVLGFLLIALVAILVALSVRDAPKKGEDISHLDKRHPQHRRNSRVLWGLLLVAIAYLGLLRSLHTLTGINLLDGGIGLALGLYVCAHPAANAVNMLFFERGTLRQSPSDGSLLRWLALNLLVLLAGWMVIFLGIRQLVAGPA